MKMAFCTTIQALEEQSKTESIVLIKSEPRISERIFCINDVIDSLSLP